MAFFRFGELIFTLLCCILGGSSFRVPPRSQPRVSPFCAGGNIDSAANRVILFDGICRFCNTWVDLVLRLDRRGVIKFAALQSVTGRKMLEKCGRSPDDISSIVYCKEGNCFVKSEAVVQVANELGIPAFVLSGLLPLGIKDKLYDAVANNRYRIMGQYESCRLTDPEFDDRFLE